jgi:hypothetical protein
MVRACSVNPGPGWTVMGKVNRLRPEDLVAVNAFAKTTFSSLTR